MMWRAMVIGIAVASLSLPAAVFAQQCPPELKQAKAKLTSAQAALKKAAKPDDVQAPRAAAGFQGGSSEAPRTAAAAKPDDVQAPRSAAGFQGGSSEAPRTAAAAKPDDVQAPRAAAGFQGGSSEAPRTAAAAKPDDVQAPRAAAGFQGGSSEAPRTAAGARTTDAQAKVTKASKLVAEAEQACKKGNMALSSEKSKAALAALK